MSAFEKFLAGWSFRGSKPDYAAGDVIEVMVTGEGDRSGEVVARIGDSTLRIEGAPEDALNTRIIVDVESWDDATHTGRATYRKTVGESAF
ncbi:hypothetical protein C463_01546 [Halorubrum californiense DSM 19288]|uniref:DUF7513 domain-containing protein n=1 Tax=Halorubrum californiense DSM 19288 TaxID=1227465 RepID=M0EKC0_9EURY|nr:MULTISPECIES: hypothetical protein [Halorubrum]ELZ48231.1 hypothetical protein C463_01546 [Halorubrum californiense DSM 19288]TKX68332.1 hypothetical protein EXE40_12785 [Halorubrum sp. GN11GM_10-3_MGM]